MNPVYPPRRPWLAAFFSTVLPGFGQFYAGDANRALGVFLAFVLLSLPLIVIVALILPFSLTAPAVALATLATIGVWIFGIFDAWKLARRNDPFVPAAWHTRTVSLTVFLLAGFVLAPSIVIYVKDNLVRSFSIPSGSMKPTLMPGDIIFADMSYNCTSCMSSVKQGDVAIFVYPDNRTQHYVKRIVGLPGDSIEINNGTLRINGDVIREGLTESDPVNNLVRNVAPGHVFVMGDNKNQSRDSRHFGDVPLSDVVARPRQVWFSYSDGGVQWSRIGSGVQGALDAE